MALAPPSQARPVDPANSRSHIICVAVDVCFTTVAQSSQVCGRLSHNPFPAIHADEHTGDDAKDDADVHEYDGVEDDGDNDLFDADVHVDDEGDDDFIVLLPCFCLFA